MAKQMVYFNATKQIETITIHYNSKLDGTFVEDVAGSIKDIAKKMSKVNLKSPKEFDSIQVFVYPSKKLFYQVFGGEIEKRFYRRKRSLEDLYVVQDSDGNIHIVSPRGMDQEKRDAFKKILVMKILGEYMEEKEKQSAERLLKEAMKPKKEDKEEKEQDEEELDEQEVEIEPEELEEDELEEEGPELEDDDIAEELSEEELEEILETELIIEQIDDTQEQEAVEEDAEKGEKDSEEKKENTRSEAQEWLSVGWLAYVRGKLKKEEDIKRFANNISKNGVKKLGQLSNTKLFENYNYSEEYACAWVEYIIQTYGMKKFIEHYENPKDIKGVFGVPKYIFETQLKAYIKERYKDDEKTLNVAQDIKLEDIVRDEKQDTERKLESPIAEVTEIHFPKGGGVDITSDKEIDEPEIKEKV